MKRKTGFIPGAGAVLLAVVMTVPAAVPAFAEDASEQMTEAAAGTEEQTLSDDPFSFQVQVNGKIVTFPCTKEAFDGTGLEWDADYADTDLASGYTTSGGRIGEAPGGIVVSVVNLSDETRKIGDCVIDDATFYFEGDDEFLFPGGITKDSTVEDVDALWEGVEPDYVYDKDNAYYVTYKYTDPENPYGASNKIEYQFFNGKLKCISVMTDGLMIEE